MTLRCPLLKQRILKYFRPHTLTCDAIRHASFCLGTGGYRKRMTKFIEGEYDLSEILFAEVAFVRKTCKDCSMEQDWVLNPGSTDGLNADITIQGVQEIRLGTKTEWWCLICGSRWLPKMKELRLGQSVQHQ